MYYRRDLVLLVALGVAFCFGFEHRQILLQRRSIDTLTTPHFHEDAKHTRQVSEFSDETNYQYYVHVARPIKDEEKKRIEDSIGTKLGVYLPHNTFLLYGTREQAERARNTPGVFWVGAVHPEDKYPSDIRAILETSKFDSSLLVHLVPELPQYSTRTLTEVELIASSWREALGSRAASIEAVANDKVLVKLVQNNKMEVVEWLAARPESHWIEPGQIHQSHNHNAGLIVQTDLRNGLAFTASGYDGTGEIVALADTGLDYNSCYFKDTVNPLVKDTLNTNARKIIKYDTTYGDFTDADGHGTHVAGTIAGNSNSNDTASFYNGIAPGARLFFFDIQAGTAGLTPPSDFNTMLTNAYTNGSRLFVASFGASNVTWYTSQARDIDSAMSTNKDLLVIVSAGNEGTGSSLSSLAVSKNALVVGGSQSNASSLGSAALPILSGPDTLASFSSHGPTPDGRIKPDVVAPAERIVSAATGACGQTAKAGTSYAAGVAAGAAAIVRQYVKINNIGGDSATPPADVVKAILINSGQPLKYYDAGQGYFKSLNHFPSNEQGFGRIQLDTTLPVGNSSTYLYVSNNDPIKTGGDFRYCFKVVGTVSVKVTLVWTDPAGSLLSGRPLISNLDLAVVNTRGDTVKTSTSDGGFDSLNNVEQIVLDRPEEGVYAAHVYGYNVPQGSQKFALVISGASSAFCDLDFDPFARVCPSQCSGQGTCLSTGPGLNGICNCTNGRLGLDCSIQPCAGAADCNGNGYCDFASGTCVCLNNYAPPFCATLKPPPSPPQLPPPDIVQVPVQGSGIDKGVFAGVVVAVFVGGCFAALIIGAFIAVKYLEYKRDQAHKAQEAEQDSAL